MITASGSCLYSHSLGQSGATCSVVQCGEWRVLSKKDVYRHTAPETYLRYKYFSYSPYKFAGLCYVVCVCRILSYVHKIND